MYKLVIQKINKKKENNNKKYQKRLSENHPGY